MRSEVDSALAALQLLSKDDSQRLAAAKALLLEPDASKMPLLLKALAAEQNEGVRSFLDVGQSRHLYLQLTAAKSGLRPLL
jgi:urea transport system permease protein